MRENVSLTELTTTKISAVSNNFYCPETCKEFIDAIRSAEDGGSSVFLLGGGSNTIFSKNPSFSIIKNQSEGIEKKEIGELVYLLCDSGVVWNKLALECVESNLQGPENLIGIPGTVGGATVQNIGAYGSSIGKYINKVVVYDRIEKKIVKFAHDDLNYSYRTSIFKTDKNLIKPAGSADKTNLLYSHFFDSRYAILKTEFVFRKSDKVAIKQKQVADILEKQVGEQESLSVVANAIINIRAKKGMLDYRFYKEFEYDTDFYSTGSFFKNPIVERKILENLPSDIPYFNDEELSENKESNNKIKISAAWLIEHSGLPKGFTLDGKAALSSKHVLAITNKNNASFDDITKLAMYVQEKVKNAYGIQLIPEAIIIK